MINLLSSQTLLLIATFINLFLSCAASPKKHPKSQTLYLSNDAVDTDNGVCPLKVGEPKGSKTLTEPIVIKEGGSHDCGNKLYKIKSESISATVFRIKGSASLSNCYFSQSGDSDTIDIDGSGSVNLTNLHFLNIGDDAVSIKGSANVNISDSTFANGKNKAIQHDGSGTVTATNSCFEKIVSVSVHVFRIIFPTS
ncbi:expressed protein [Phakopsora pachyrhizi]|uniref:Pectate lyase n=1 Tax=Phakopsora pachyrhizi TaxID=170000 RepID=A0AAV0AW08_PHAPC|nr:expressed protein [Phakopsora pachyrhizi]